MKKLLLSLILLSSILMLSTRSIAQNQIKWYTLNEAIELNKIKPKKIFIDFYTDWCGWCKSMDQSTFAHPFTVQFMNEYYYPVKFNAEQTDSILYKGKYYKNQNPKTPKSTHDLALELLNNKLSYPTYLFLDENLNTLTIYPGFVSVLDIDPILKFFAYKIYTCMSWEDFRGHYTSDVKTSYEAASKDAEQFYKDKNFPKAFDAYQYLLGLSPLNKEFTYRYNELKKMLNK